MLHVLAKVLIIMLVVTELLLVLLNCGWLFFYPLTILMQIRLLKYKGKQDIS